MLNPSTTTTTSLLSFTCSRSSAFLCLLWFCYFFSLWFPASLFSMNSYFVGFHSFVYCSLFSSKWMGSGGRGSITIDSIISTTNICPAMAGSPSPRMIIWLKHRTGPSSALKNKDSILPRSASIGRKRTTDPETQMTATEKIMLKDWFSFRNWDGACIFVDSKSETNPRRHGLMGSLMDINTVLRYL